MATKSTKKAAPAAKAAPKKELRIFGVKEICEEFGIEGRKLRQKLRAEGMNAPAIPEDELAEGGFGPRAKYAWTEGSEELEKVRAIAKAVAETPTVVREGKKTKATRRKKEAEVVAEEVLDDEDEEEDEDELDEDDEELEDDEDEDDEEDEDEEYEDEED